MVSSNENQNFGMVVLHPLIFTSFSELLIYTFLRSDNLSLDLHDVSISWIVSDTSCSLSLYFAWIV